MSTPRLAGLILIGLVVTAAPTAADGADIKVMSFNIRYG
jgi:hypothetical protein